VEFILSKVGKQCTRRAPRHSQQRDEQRTRSIDAQLAQQFRLIVASCGWQQIM
jgi:hypothetical protein